MKQGWEIKQLKEIADYFIGLTYSPKDVSDKGTIVLRSSNIQNGKLDFKDIIRVNRPIKGGLKVKQGDILMCSRNGSKRLVGKTAAIEGLEEEMTFGTFMTVIRSKYNPFLTWFFISDEFRDQIGGGENPMINQITKYMLDDIKIPLPPFPEQQRIIAILDEAFGFIAKARANTEQNLKNAKELFESYLQSVFDDIKSDCPMYPLANYLDLITYGFTNPMPTTDSGPYMVTAKNVKGGIVDYTTSRRTSQEAFDNLITDKCRPIKGDVLLTKDGTLGRVAVVEFSNLCINQSVALLRPNSKISPYYLRELLSSRFYQRKMVEQAGGATIKHIYITRVDKMEVPVPSIYEQQSIVNKLGDMSSETKKLEVIYQQKLNDLEELKKSVLQKAFSGDLKTTKAITA